MKRIGVLLGAAVLVLALGYAAFQLSCRPSLSKLQSQADSLGGVYSQEIKVYSQDTLETDLVLAADSAKPATRKAVQKERASATRVINTAEEQKQNYRQQIKVLSPLLQVFVEGNYESPALHPFSARAGVALRLQQSLHAQLFVRQQLGGRPSINLGVRKTWRLF